jgi:phage head maturation protease
VRNVPEVEEGDVNGCSERFGSRREHREYDKKDKKDTERIREWDNVEDVKVSEMKGRAMADKFMIEEMEREKKREECSIHNLFLMTIE